MLDRLIDRWNTMATPVEQRLCDALHLIERLHDERLELQRRIRNQRMSDRETWEIVEMRRKWLGSETARTSLIRHIKWLRVAHQKIRELEAGNVANGEALRRNFLAGQPHHDSKD